MKVTYLLITNIDEIEKAQNLGIRIPEPEYTKRPMLINISKIKYARQTLNNCIEIKVDKDYFLIEYSKEIWDAIEKAINER